MSKFDLSAVPICLHKDDGEGVLFTENDEKPTPTENGKTKTFVSTKSWNDSSLSATGGGILATTSVTTENTVPVLEAGASATAEKMIPILCPTCSENVTLDIESSSSTGTEKEKKIILEPTENAASNPTTPLDTKDVVLQLSKLAYTGHVKLDPSTSPVTRKLTMEQKVNQHSSINKKLRKRRQKQNQRRRRLQRMRDWNSLNYFQEMRHQNQVAWHLHRISQWNMVHHHIQEIQHNQNQVRWHLQNLQPWHPIHHHLLQIHQNHVLWHLQNIRPWYPVHTQLPRKRCRKQKQGCVQLQNIGSSNSNYQLQKQTTTKPIKLESTEHTALKPNADLTALESSASAATLKASPKPTTPASIQHDNVEPSTSSVTDSSSKKEGQPESCRMFDTSVISVTLEDQRNMIPCALASILNSAPKPSTRTIAESSKLIPSELEHTGKSLYSFSSPASFGNFKLPNTGTLVPHEEFQSKRARISGSSNNTFRFFIPSEESVTDRSDRETNSQSCQFGIPPPDMESKSCQYYLKSSTMTEVSDDLGICTSNISKQPQKPDSCTRMSTDKTNYCSTCETVPISKQCVSELSSSGTGLDQLPLTAEFSNTMNQLCSNLNSAILVTEPCKLHSGLSTLAAFSSAEESEQPVSVFGTPSSSIEHRSILKASSGKRKSTGP